MSNVLIGIIGVILFIGLALAGALFLGERFAQSRNTSVASAAVQSVAQIANAINLYNAENGAPLRAGEDPLMLTQAGARYLKALPINPTGSDAAVILTVDGNGSGGEGRLVTMRLSGADLDVCRAIARQTSTGLDTIGQSGVTEVSVGSDIPKGPAGCFMAKAAFGAFGAGSYHAFARP